MFFKAFYFTIECEMFSQWSCWPIVVLLPIFVQLRLDENLARLWNCLPVKNLTKNHQSNKNELQNLRLSICLLIEFFPKNWLNSNFPPKNHDFFFRLHSCWTLLPTYLDTLWATHTITSDHISRFLSHFLKFYGSCYDANCSALLPFSHI